MKSCPFNQLTALTANLTELNQIELYMREFESVQEIRNFLQSHQTLVKAHFSMTYDIVNENEMQILRHSLENEWNFEEHKVDHIFMADVVLYDFVFIRKNSALSG